MTGRTENRFCVIVPAYREAGRIGRVVEGIKKYCGTVVVVDDGSSDGTAEEAEKAGAVVLRHQRNMGKGVALNTGFSYARENWFEFLITMDADGQHDPSDIPGFLEMYGRDGLSVIIGNRMADPRGMPFVRRMTNRFMSWFLSRKMGQRVPDTQSGFRLYRCDVIPEKGMTSDRFAAESEILLFMAEAGAKMGSVPMKVIYRDEKSKINPVRDTVRFFKMVISHGKKNNRLP